MPLLLSISNTIIIPKVAQQTHWQEFTVVILKKYFRNEQGTLMSFLVLVTKLDQANIVFCIWPVCQTDFLPSR